MKQKLKIGILIDQLVPGGVQKSALLEAKELVKLGHQVTLFVLIKVASTYQYEDLTHGLRVIYLSDLNPRLFQVPIHIPYFAFLTHLHLINPFFVNRYQLLKTYDFLISHGTTTCITAAAISQKLGVPYLAFIWDPMLYIWQKVYSQKPIGIFSPLITRLIRYYEQKFIAQATLVATSSKVHQQFIRQTYQVEPLVIYPGCFPPRRLLPKTDNYILGYTRWELAKNPYLFLYLAQKLPQAKFLIAGSWTTKFEQDSFKKLIYQQKLTKRIKLLTSIPQQNVREIAQKSLVWVHPHFEAFGLSGLEMAAYGLPLIIPQGSGVTEIFKHKMHGFFPPKSNKQEFLTYIDKLLKNKQLATNMGQAATRIARKLTWKRHTVHVLNEIHSYLSQKSITVLEICKVIGSALSGGDKLMEPMARRLISKFHFSIITSFLGADHWQKANFTKTLFTLPKNIFDPSSQPVPVFLSYCLRMWQTTKLLLTQKVRIICSSTNLLPDILPAYLVKKRYSNITWIARIHHLIPPPHQREGRLIVNLVSYLMQLLALKLIKSTADIIIALNPQLKNELLQKGFLPHRLTILGAGIDFQKIVSVKALPRTPAFTGIYLGRLHPAKGIYDLVPIWQRVTREIPSSRLGIIGEGPNPYINKLRQQINKAHLKSQISILGVLPESEVFSLLKRTQVFLFTDHEAGFGLAVAEAMACGLPVVGYDIGILGSVFTKGYLKVPKFDCCAFAQEITKLITQPRLHRHLSRQAKLQAKKHTLYKISQQFEFLIKHI